MSDVVSAPVSADVSAPEVVQSDKFDFSPKPKAAPQERAEPKIEPKAEPVAPRKIKVKVDGNESEIDEAELVARYQKSTSAEKKFQEASQKMKQTEAFMKQLKEDPISVLNNPALGLDFRREAESYLEGILNDELMDPKDKKIRDSESELEKYRREDVQRREDAAREQEIRRTEEFERLKTKHAEEYTRTFQEALEAEGLPKSPQTVRRMAQYMEQAIKQGVKVSAAEVAALVKDDYMQEHKSMLSSMPADRLAEILGQEAVDRLRQANVAKYRNERAPMFGDNKPAHQPRAVAKANRISSEDYFRSIRDNLPED